MNAEEILREKFISAAIRLMQRLRLKEECLQQSQPLCRTHKASGRLAIEICRQPISLSYIENPRLRKSPWIEAPVHIETVNHPVNQYIRWLLIELDIRIEQANKIVQLTPKPLTKSALQVILNDPLYAKVHQLGTSLLELRMGHETR